MKAILPLSYCDDPAVKSMQAAGRSRSSTYRFSISYTNALLLVASFFNVH